MKELVYLRKAGTLETFCVFKGDMLQEQPGMNAITKAEHEGLIKQREKIIRDERAAKAEGYGSLAEKAKAKRVANEEAKEAKATEKKLADRKKKTKKTAKPKAKAPEKKEEENTIDKKVVSKEKGK